MAPVPLSVRRSINTSRAWRLKTVEVGFLHASLPVSSARQMQRLDYFDPERFNDGLHAQHSPVLHTADGVL